MKKNGFVNSILSKMRKRGLSTVVITLIIILISLVAVGIIWVVVRNVIQTGTKEVTLGQFTLDAKIKDVNVDNIPNNVSLTVRRNPGQGEFSKMNFVFYDGKSSEVITQPVSLNQLEERRFMFHLSILNVSNLISISIVPFIKQDQKEVLGIILDKYNLEGNINSLVQCVPTTCLALGYTCGNWGDGCSGTLGCGVFGNGSCQTGYTCISGSCQLTNNLCNNLVLLMHFDNNSGVGENSTFVYDWSGNGNYGIAVNNSRINLTGGKYNGAVVFGNKDDFVYSPVVLSSNANMSGTLSFWIYYKASQYGDGFVVFDNLFSLAALDGLSGFNTGRLSYQRTRLYSGMAFVGAEVISSANIYLNQWSLYTLTWNQTSGRIYRNGILDNEDATVTLPYTSLVKLYVGSDRGIMGRSMNGSIDDLAIWNRTLTDSEILNIYNSGTAINC